MRLDGVTMAFVAVAGAAVALTWADPFADDSVSPVVVSEHSVARRLFPVLQQRGAADATITLQAPGAPKVVLTPGDGGHQVMVDDVVLGPADPDAMDGLWSSLRMATTVRAVPEGTAVGAAQRGSIAVRMSDASVEVVLGADSPDGAGLYGVVTASPQDAGDVGTWLVEHELGALLDQSPHAWVSARVALLTPSELAAVRFEAASIVRGIDGLWRAQTPQGTAFLEPAATDARLSRLLGARLSPLRPVGDAVLEPWATLQTIDGRTVTLSLGPSCGPDESRRLLARGPGLGGCIDAPLVQSWALPPSPEGARFIHPRLLPHEYGRVLAIEQRSPDPQVLRRHGGGWVIERGGAEMTEQPEPEVFAWYQALSEAEVEPDVPPDGTPLELLIRTDATAQLRLRCRVSTSTWCRRDEGPWLRVREPTAVVGFGPDTFRPRRLVSMTVDDVRAVEIEPGTAGVRQSAHLDLGVWRLDAPDHPDGDDALGADPLERLLLTVAGLRATAWADPPTRGPLRTIVVEGVPRSAGPSAVSIALFDDCVVVVDGARPARIDAAACQRLGSDLLVATPLQFWMLAATRIEFTEAGQTRRLVREGDHFTGDEDGTVQARLNAWAQRSAVAVVPGPRPGPPLASVRFVPDRGVPFVVELGADFIRLSDAPWHYRLPPTP